MPAYPDPDKQADCSIQERLRKVERNQTVTNIRLDSVLTELRMIKEGLRKKPQIDPDQEEETSIADDVAVS